MISTTTATPGMSLPKHSRRSLLLTAAGFALALGLALSVQMVSRAGPASDPAPPASVNLPQTTFNCVPGHCPIPIILHP